MTQVKMPEPVAFLVDWPDEPDLGHYFAEEQATIGRSQPLITTTQAEAYADARVREALEEAAEIADRNNDFSTYDAIRALMPPLSGPVEPKQEAS